MASRRVFQAVDKNDENIATNARRENEIDPSAVFHNTSQNGLANSSDSIKNCIADGDENAGKRTKAYAPARISRPLQTHFADVIVKALENSSSSSINVIDRRTYDTEYDTLYAVEIIEYMRQLELERQLPCNFLLNQPGSLSSRNRAIIIDWLIQVQHYLKLMQETLYLTVSLFDHFFVKVLNFPVEKLQLVAISCLLIASKMEERYTPELKILLHLTDNAYINSHILKMENYILNMLGFQLVMPDMMVFLNRCFQAANNTSKEVENLSTFLIDIMLPDVKACCKLLPSKMAASAFCLARKLLVTNEVTWNKTLEHYSGYKEHDIKETMIWMLCTVAESADAKYEFQGVRTKYASKSTYQNLSGSPVLKAKAIVKVLQVMSEGKEPVDTKETGAAL